MTKVLIIGGSGGIGSAIAERYASNHPDYQVVATYYSKPSIGLRYPNLHWEQLDASDEQQVKRLAETHSKLDLLINAIGTLHTEQRKPEKSVADFDPEFFQHNIRLNTLPSLLLAKHFASALKAKSPSYFVSLSAKIGSIEDNRLGGWISYRSSKAAMNMALKTISIEWRYKVPNCCVVAFHPGTTDTQLSKPFQSNVPAEKLFCPHYVAQCLMDLIHNTTADKSGTFFSYDGAEISW